MTDPYLSTTFTDNLSFSSVSSDYASSDVRNHSSLTSRDVHHTAHATAAQKTTTSQPPQRQPQQPERPQRHSPVREMPALEMEVSQESLLRSPSPTNHDRLASGNERFYDDDEDIPLSQIDVDSRRHVTRNTSSTDTNTTTHHNTSAPSPHATQEKERVEAGDGELSEGTSPTSAARTRQSSSYGFGVGLGPPTFLHGGTVPHAQSLDTTTTTTTTTESRHRAPPLLLPTSLPEKDKAAMSEVVALFAPSSGRGTTGESFSTTTTSAGRAGAISSSAGGGSSIGNAVSSKHGNLTVTATSWHTTNTTSSAPSPYPPPSPSYSLSSGVGAGASSSTSGSKKKSPAAHASSTKANGKETFEWENVEAYLWAAYTALRTNNEGVMSSFNAPKHRMGWYTVIYSVCNNDPSMSWDLYARLGATVERALEVVVLYPLLQRIDRRLVTIRTDTDDSAGAAPSGDGTSSLNQSFAAARHAFGALFHSPSSHSGSNPSGAAPTSSSGGNSNTAAAAAPGAGAGTASGSPLTNAGTHSTSRRGSVSGTPTGTPHMRPAGGSFHFMRRFFFGTEEAGAVSPAASPAHHAHAATSSGDGPSTRVTSPGMAPLSTPSTTSPVNSDVAVHASGGSGGKPRSHHALGKKRSKGKVSTPVATPIASSVDKHEPTSTCLLFKKEYADFAVFQRIVLSCFSYLDQFYTQRFGMDKITAMCIKLFYTVIFEPTHPILMYEILSRARRLRDITSAESGGQEWSSAAPAQEPSTVFTRRADNPSEFVSAAAGATDVSGRTRVISDEFEEDTNIIADTVGIICELLTAAQARPSYLVSVETAAMGRSGRRPSPSASHADRHTGTAATPSLMRQSSRQSSAASSVMTTPRMGPIAQPVAADSALQSPTVSASEATSATITPRAGGLSPAATNGGPAPLSKRRRFLNFWTRKDDKSGAASRTSSQPPAHSAREKEKHKSGRHDAAAAAAVDARASAASLDQALVSHPNASDTLSNTSEGTSSGTSEGTSSRSSRPGVGPDDNEEDVQGSRNDYAFEVDLRGVIDLHQRLNSPQLVRALGMQAYRYVPPASPASYMSAMGNPASATTTAASAGAMLGSGNSNNNTVNSNVARNLSAMAANGGHVGLSRFDGSGGAGGVPGAAPTAGVPPLTPLVGSIVMEMTASVETLVLHIFGDLYLSQLDRYYREARDRHLRSPDGRRTYIAWLRRAWDMEHAFIRKSNMPFLHQAVRRTLTDALITSVHREIILDGRSGFGAVLDVWAGVRGDDGLVSAVLDAPVGAVLTRASVHARHATTASFSLSTASRVVPVGQEASFGGSTSATLRQSRGRAYVSAGSDGSGGPSGRPAAAAMDAAAKARGHVSSPAPTPVEAALAVGQFFWAFTRADYDESCLLLLASVFASRVIAQAAVTMRTYAETLDAVASPGGGGASGGSASERRSTVPSLRSATPTIATATGTRPSSALPTTASDTSRPGNARTEAAADAAVEDLLMGYQRARTLIEVEMRSHPVMLSALHDALREALNPHRWTRKGALAASEMRVRAMANLTNNVGTGGGAWQLPSVLLSKDAGARATAPLTALSQDFPFSASLCVAEMMANYCDHILQRQFSGPGVNASVSPEVEAHFRAIASLASLLDDKDVFLEHTRLRLARRLLDLPRPANLRAEHVLVQAFQGVFTLEDVYSLEAMLRDVFNGENAAAQFAQSKEYVALVANNNSNPVITSSGGGTAAAARLRVRVLTCVGWPVQLQSLEVRLPLPLQRGVSAFEAFYARRHASRRVRWAHALASVTLLAELPHGQKEVVANMYQAIVLLAVSEASQNMRPASVTTAEVDGGLETASTPPSSPRERTRHPLGERATSDITTSAAIEDGSFASALSSLHAAVISPSNGPLNAEADSADLITAGTSPSRYGGLTAMSSWASPTGPPRIFPGGATHIFTEDTFGWISGAELAQRTGLTFAQLRPHLASVTLHGPTALVRRLPPASVSGGARPHSADPPETSSVDEAPLTAATGVPAALTAAAGDRIDSSHARAWTDTPPVAAHRLPHPGSAQNLTVSITSVSSTAWSRAAPLHEDDRFTLNREFHHPQRRILLPARRNGLPLRTAASAVGDGPTTNASVDGATSVPTSDVQPWRSTTAMQVEQSLKASRVTRMDATLVRIMKGRRVLPYVELVELATEQLAPQFLPTNRELKERLTALIERGFLQRSATAENTLQYVA